MQNIDDLLQQQAEEQTRQEQIRNSVGRFFSALEKTVQEQVAVVNGKYFGGKETLTFGYEANTITGDHFLVRKLAFPALIAKLEQQSGGLFQITISEKPSPEHDDYEVVERAQLNVIIDDRDPKLSHEGRVITMSEGAGVMLSPLVTRTLGLRADS
jgi:hypothetical protein